MSKKELKELPLIKFFQQDVEKINMAFRLSDTIRKNVNNLRAAGDEVELAVRDFYKTKLSPRYYVGDGHIVDSNLKVSPQYDLIICENSKNPVLFRLADKSDLIYFEPVFCFAEVKRSYYSHDLLSKFSENIKRFYSELNREEIPSNFIETGNTGIQVEQPLTNLPLRNPILKFMFFVDSSKLVNSKLREALETIEVKYLPNFIVLLDVGIIVNICKKSYEDGNIKINLYPEYQSEENIWVILNFDESNTILTYQYMLLVEHLNSSIVGTPEIRNYTRNLFGISLSNISKI